MPATLFVSTNGGSLSVSRAEPYFRGHIGLVPLGAVEPKQFQSQSLECEWVRVQHARRHEPSLRVSSGLYGAQENFQPWLNDFIDRAFTDSTGCDAVKLFGRVLGKLLP